MPEDAELSEEVWEPVQRQSLSRSFDRVPRVRAAAAAALCRLQTTADPADDPFAARLLEMISEDSSASVRKAALQAVAVTDTTLPFVVRRTRDIRPDVRRVAFVILARKVNPFDVEVIDRVAVLRAGLSDRDSGVRKVCTDTLLLEGWLDGACDGNVFELVELLGSHECEDDVLLALRAVFKSKTHEGLVDAIQIDVNNLTHADILVLRALADTRKGDAFIDKFIPSTLTYSEVLLYYSVDDFAVRHLLELCKSVDMSDEAGREALELVIRENFLAGKTISEETVTCSVRAMRRATPDEETAVRLMLDIVRLDILGDAIGEVEDGENATSVEEQSSEENSWGELRALNICMEVLRGSSQSDSVGSVVNGLCRSLVEVAVLPQLLCIDVLKRRSAMECMGLFCLLDRSGREARQHMPIFIQASKNDVPEIQELAIQVIIDCMMVFDFNNDDEGEKENELTSPGNLDEVEATASASDVLKQEKNLSALAEDCIAFLSQNTTHADGNVRSLSVQGLSRLLFVRRISPSPMLLSRMMIAHHNPSTEDDDMLRQCLSVFFPMFASSAPDNRLGLEDSFKPTCSLLFAAPSKSPLSKISVLQVAEFILYLTNPANARNNLRKHSVQNTSHSADHIHERLAETVLNGIIDAIDTDEIDVYREYGRILSRFRFSHTAENAEQLEVLQKLSRFAFEETDDKRLKTVLKRFRERVLDLLQTANVASTN